MCISSIWDNNMITIKNVTGLALAGLLLTVLFFPSHIGLTESDNIIGNPPDISTLQQTLYFNEDRNTLISLPGESLDSSDSNTESTTLELAIPFTTPLIKNTGDSDFLEIILDQDVQYTNKGGYPHMPYKANTLFFPLGTQIQDLQITPLDIQTIPLSNPVKPSLYPSIVSPLAFHGEKGLPVAIPVNDSYPPISCYPSQWGTYSLGGGLHNNQRVTFLTLYTYPCRYLPALSLLQYTPEITIQLTYKQPPTCHTCGDAYDYLIIAPSSYQDSLQPLVNHKNSHGIQTKLVTTTEIYNGTYFPTHGRDHPENIKYFLKNAIENWGVTHTVLVGDLESVPSRKVYSFWWGDHPMFSDHYYADIYDSSMEFCSWDSNQNNLFGERDPERESTSNDFVDLYADLYLGRLACSNTEEVATIVNKIITYETTSNGKDWFQRLVLMGGDTFPSWNNIMEGELVNEYVADVMPDFTPIKIQMSAGNFLPHRINQILSDGAGFVCYSGHGFEYGFGTYPENNRWMIAYYTPYLLGLKNADKLPIVFFDACLTAKLDYYLLGNHDIPCFAWAMVKKPNGGAIATIGATETATTTVDENGPRGQAGYLDLHFFMAYTPGISLGEMLVQAQNDYLRDIDQGTANDRFYEMTIEQFILLGDPTVIPGGYP